MTITDDQSATRRRGGNASTRADGTRQRSAAAQRALDRRRKRLAAEPVSEDRGRGGRVRSPQAKKATHDTPRSLTRLATAPIRAARRVPFAVVVAGLLVAGLALTLWLSTKSAQDSYQLGAAREQNEQLSDRVDALKKAYESGDSAPELSGKASGLGMIPATDVPRMVIGPDGKETVVGDIEPADGPKAPSMNDTPPPSSPSPTTDNRTQATPTNGQQGTPVTPDGNATPSPEASPTPDPSATTGQGPANPAAPPTFSNVLPSTGGAPGSNSGQTR